MNNLMILMIVKALRLKRASLEDKLLQNFEENAALRSQASSENQIARMQSVPRPPVKIAT